MAFFLDYFGEDFLVVQWREATNFGAEEISIYSVRNEVSVGSGRLEIPCLTR